MSPSSSTACTSAITSVPSRPARGSSTRAASTRSRTTSASSTPSSNCPSVSRSRSTDCSGPAADRPAAPSTPRSPRSPGRSSTSTPTAPVARPNLARRSQGRRGHRPDPPSARLLGRPAADHRSPDRRLLGAAAGQVRPRLPLLALRGDEAAPDGCRRHRYRRLPGGGRAGAAAAQRVAEPAEARRRPEPGAAREVLVQRPFCRPWRRQAGDHRGRRRRSRVRRDREDAR